MGWIKIRRESTTREPGAGYCLAREDSFPDVYLGPGKLFRPASSYDCSVDNIILKFGTRVCGFFLVEEGDGCKVRIFQVERRGSYFSILSPTISSLNCQWSFALNRWNISTPFRFFWVTVPISHFPFLGFLSLWFIEGSLSRLLGLFFFVLTTVFTFLSSAGFVSR